MVRRIKCEVHYPWAGVEPDVEIIEIDEKDYVMPLTTKDLEEAALECIEDMLWNRVSINWEEVEEDGEE